MEESDNSQDKLFELLKQIVPESKTQTLDALSKEDLENLVHELLVKQSKLENQNKELLEAKLEFKKSYDSYSELYDFAPVGYYTLDGDGLILQVNLTGAALLGAERRQLIKEPFSGFIAEEDQDTFHAHFAAAFKTQTKKMCELKLRKHDGVQFYAGLESKITGDSDDQKGVCRTILSDITKLKRFEGLVRKSRETFAALLDAISEAAFLLSPEGVVLAANQTTVDRLNKTFQDVIGKSIFDLLDYDLAKSRQIYIDQVVGTGCPVQFEDERLGRSIHHSLYPSFDRRGKVAAVAGYSIDVTNQRQTQKELEKYRDHLEELVQDRTDELNKINEQLVQEVAEREQAQRDVQMSVSLLRAVFDAISDGLLVGNLVHGVESLNRRFKEIWGLTNEFVKSADSAKMLELSANQTKDPVGFVKRIEEIYSPSVTESFDEIELTDGRILERRSKLYLIGEKTYGRVWSYKDVTERILAQRELLVARDQAQAADQAKSAFLAMMSHEIRTPINAVMGLSYLCLQTDVTPKQKDYLEKIHRSSEALLRIINDVLDFSKIEAGRLEIELVDFDLENVVRNVVVMISMKAEQKSLELRFCIDQRIPGRLIGDPLRLEQVIKNLADNAVKFTERGKVIISVELLDDQPDQVKLRFSVSDTGIGLSEEQISNLFQAFVQADSSTTRKYGGSGLGLSICKRLVEMMGGEISVVSRPGEGTTFSFVLDLGRRADAFPEQGLPPGDIAGAQVFHEDVACFVGASVVSAREKELEVAQKIAGAKILLIEDNEINQQIAMELLARAGLIVTVANDGQEGVDAVHSGQFDAVLTDIQMPVMDGYLAAARIRENPKFANLPIIAMTAHAMACEREKCISAGMNDYVSKPIDPYLLYCVLLKWIAPGYFVSGVQAPSPAIAKEPVPDIDCFPDLPGINVASGITRVGGDHQFYRRMLRKFRQSHVDDSNLIARALENGDVETSERLAHTLKGVSGGLGADALRLASQELELMIKDGKTSRLGQCLDDVRSEFELVISSISLLDQADESAPKPEVAENDAGSGIGNQEVLILFDKLRTLMADNDTASLDMVADIGNRLAGSMFHANMEPIREALEHYDFDKGIEILDEIIGELNLSESED